MKKLLFCVFTFVLTMAAFAQEYHDAALYNAPNGRVRYIDYVAGRICFNEDGSIDKANSPYLMMYSKYEIEYDGDGYPVSLTTNSDKTLIEYDDQKRIVKRTVSGSSNFTVSYEYIHEYYGKDKIVVTTNSMENGHPKQNETTYDIVTYDDRNNWTSKGVVGQERKSTNVQYTHVGSYGNGDYIPTFTTTTYYDGHEKEDRVIAYYTDNVFTTGEEKGEVSFAESLYPFCSGTNTPKYAINSLKRRGIEYKNKKDIAHFLTANSCDNYLFGIPITKMKAVYYDDKSFGDYSYYLAFKTEEQRGDFCVFLMEQLAQEGVEFHGRDLKAGITFRYKIPRQYVDFEKEVLIKMAFDDDYHPSVLIGWPSNRLQ